MNNKVMEIYGRWGFQSVADVTTVFQISPDGAQTPCATAIGKTQDVRETHARLIATGLNLADCSNAKQRKDS